MAGTSVSVCNLWNASKRFIPLYPTIEEHKTTSTCLQVTSILFEIFLVLGGPQELHKELQWLQHFNEDRVKNSLLQWLFSQFDGSELLIYIIHLFPQNETTASLTQSRRVPVLLDVGLVKLGPHHFFYIRLHWKFQGGINKSEL